MTPKQDHPGACKGTSSEFAIHLSVLQKDNKVEQQKAKWVKNRKYNIPKKYPIIGFSHRHINNIVTFNNYDYLKYY